MTDPSQALTATEDTHLPPEGGNGHHEDGLRWRELVSELDGLERRLATQPVIEQAKGILIGPLRDRLRHGIRCAQALVVTHKPQSARHQPDDRARYGGCRVARLSSSSQP